VVLLFGGTHGLADRVIVLVDRDAVAVVTPLMRPGAFAEHRGEHLKAVDALVILPYPCLRMRTATSANALACPWCPSVAIAVKQGLV